MTSAEPQLVTTVRNHWWWRPGWRTGRHFYACHLTLDDQPQLWNWSGATKTPSSNLPNLDLIPPQWLHITTQGIGFADEISPADLTAVTAAVQERLRDLEPPVATFHRATILPEAVLLKANPPQPLYQLRLALYDAIASALGPAKFTEPRPEPGAVHSARQRRLRQRRRASRADRPGDQPPGPRAGHRDVPRGLAARIPPGPPHVRVDPRHAPADRSVRS